MQRQGHALLTMLMLSCYQCLPIVMDEMAYLSARTAKRAALSWQVISNKGSEWYMMYKASSMAVQSSSSSGMVKQECCVSTAALPCSAEAGLLLPLGQGLLLCALTSSRRFRSTPGWISRTVGCA